MEYFTFYIIYEHQNDFELQCSSSLLSYATFKRDRGVLGGNHMYFRSWPSRTLTMKMKSCRSGRTHTGPGNALKRYKTFRKSIHPFCTLALLHSRFQLNSAVTGRGGGGAGKDASSLQGHILTNNITQFMYSKCMFLFCGWKLENLEGTYTTFLL